VRRFAFGNFRVVMGAYIMNAFNVVQYAKTRLLLAEKKQDASEIEKWRRNLAYWQQYMKRKQQLSKEI
jgi:activator of 2-hydroxyglutaryl-CoA dehydratase